MSNEQQLVGWGIIGTPKGRQAVGEGLDKQLKLANSYDLPQEFCGYLPSPTQKDFTPLYCLQLLISNSVPVLSLAEYRPIFEQNQTRSGSYFGSFIEVANHRFNDNVALTLFETLFELSSYQTTHFIDQANTRYKESITGKSCPTPQKIGEIASELTPLNRNLFSQTKPKSALYITCRSEQLCDLLNAILKEELYYHYQQIFFSESAYITSQIDKKTPVISAQTVIENPLLLSPFKKEMDYLYQSLHQQITLTQQTNDELTNLKNHQEAIIAQQVAEKEQEYRSIVIAYQDNEQIYRQNEQAYQQNEEFYKKDIEQKEQALKNAEQKIASLSAFGNYGQHIQQYHQDIITRLGNIERNIVKSGQVKAISATPAEPQIIYREKPLNKFLAVLSTLLALLLAIAVGVGIYLFLNDDSQTLKNQLNSSETLDEYCLQLNEQNQFVKRSGCKTKLESEVEILKEQLLEKQQEFNKIMSGANNMEKSPSTKK